MTAPTMYYVGVKLTADDKEVRDAISSLSAGTAAASVKAVSSVQLLKESFRGISQAMSGFRYQYMALTRTYQTVRSIVGFGLKDAIMGAVGVNQELENLEMGLATVLSAVDVQGGGKFAKLADAQREVNHLMAVMRDEAAKTPAEFEGVAQSFQNILPLTRDLTANLDDIAKIAANAASWDIIGGNKTGTTAADIKQILGGQMALQMIQNPMLKQNLDKMRDLAEQARKLEKAGNIAGSKADRAEMLRIIQKLLELSPEVKAMYENSFTGQVEQLKGRLRQLAQEGMAPLWQDLKNALARLNDWAKSPEGAAKLREYAHDAGIILRDAAIFLKDVFKFFIDNISTIKTVFLTFMGIWASANVLRFSGALVMFVKAIRGASFMDFGRALLGLKGETLPGTPGSVLDGTQSMAGRIFGTTFGQVAAGMLGLATVIPGLISAFGALQAKIDEITGKERKGAAGNATMLGIDPKSIPKNTLPLNVIRGMMSVGLPVPESDREFARMQSAMTAMTAVKTATGTFQDLYKPEYNRFNPMPGEAPKEATSRIVLEIVGEMKAVVKDAQAAKGTSIDVRGVGTSSVGSGVLQ